MGNVDRESDKGHQQGALRAALDAYLAASSPQTLDGSASSGSASSGNAASPYTSNGLPATHPASINPSPAARFGTATLANRQTAFDNLLNLWTGVDSIAASARSSGLSLRQATILELVYGAGYQNADFEQAGIWGIAYRDLTEGLYASLAAQTHLTADYALIDWQVHANINEEIGHLDAVTAVFKQRLAAAIVADAAQIGARISHHRRRVMRKRRCVSMLMNSRFRRWQLARMALGAGFGLIPGMNSNALQ